MADAALFGDDEVAVPVPVTGTAAAALEEALEDGELTRKYPAGVALARAVMRAVDQADSQRKPAVIAQLVRPAVEVLRPLGLMPADVAPGVGAGVPAPGMEAAGVILGNAGKPTLVHSA